MVSKKIPKNLLAQWIIVTLIAAFCLYWENQFYFYLESWVNSVKTTVPYDPLFHLLPAINFYGLIKIGLPLTFLLALIGLFRKFYQLPYLLFMMGFWWIARWTCMISIVFAVPPDRPIGPCGFFLIDFLDKVIPNGIMVYGQSFMFSGHVGLPALVACLFYSKTYPFFSKKWFKENWLSNSLFIWSLIMGIVVVFSRSHYTIDVIVAWGMTYAIYSLGRVIFRPIERLGENLKQSFQNKETK